MELTIKIEDIPKVRGLIASANTSLYKEVVSSLSDNTRNTPEQLECLNALETAIAVYRSSALQIRKELDTLTLEQRLDARKSDNPFLKQEDAPLHAQYMDSIFFSNRYAIAFAGHIGLALLNSEKAEVQSLFKFDELETSLDRDQITKEIGGIVAHDLHKVIKKKNGEGLEVDDETLKHTLEAVFTSWINQFNPGSYKNVNTDIKLKYDKFTLDGETFKQSNDMVIIDDKFMTHRKEDVIGGQEFGANLWSQLLQIGCYDHEQQKNPFTNGGVVFVHGDPGCGKTYNAHGHIQSFADLCKEKGIPLWAFTHSTSDYASSFQNKTANALAELAQKIREFPGAVVMYVADADNIFTSRKDAGLRPEQKHTLSVYFKMFDGTAIPKNGKFLSIMDANYLENIDDATKSRLFDKIYQLGRFETAQQFGEYARRLLTKGVEGYELTDAQWNGIGNYLLESPLSNREAANVIDQIRSSFTITEDLLDRAFEDQVRYRNEQLSSITQDEIIGRFRDYAQDRLEIERAAEEARYTDDRMRFLNNTEKDGNQHE